jgi:hypothetical protein
MSAAEEYLEGRVLFERYRVDERIGRGGMGIVYRARDLRLERDVAVKVLTTMAADPREQAALRAALRREATIAARIRHSNVVTVFDHGTDPTLQLDFLVMELLVGEDLGARVRRVGLPRLHSALCVLRDVAAGLAAGHRAGLVHRDVKPGNIFLERADSGRHPRAKVLDFGIASGLADAGTEVLCADPNPHTPRFASPEQLLGGRPITPASDVFSLGAVGIFLLGGHGVGQPERPGTDGVAVQEALRRVADERHLPHPLAQILARALSPDPAARYPDAGEIRDELDAMLRDVEGGATGPGRVERARQQPEDTPSEGLTPAAGGDPLEYVESRTVALPRGWVSTSAITPQTETPASGGGSPASFRAAGAVILVLCVWGMALYGAGQQVVIAWLALALSSFVTPVALRTGGRLGGSVRFAALAAAAGGVLAALLLSGTDNLLVLVIAVLGAQLVMARTGLWLSTPVQRGVEDPHDRIHEASVGLW